MIYLDYAATTPVDPAVLDAMTPYFCKVFANPSSKHVCGKEAHQAMCASRTAIARCLGAEDEEIIFTAGASEANNLAIKGIAELYDEPKHFITSAFEHKATLKAMECLEEWGHRVTYITPDSEGWIDPTDVEEAIEDDTVLCSIMHVNNEIGIIQPIDSIAEICKYHDVLFHTDATQSYGKMPISVRKMNIDLLSLSAHKLYGPKGVGALFCANGLDIRCQISGGSQEGGKRAGTSNVPGVVGMSKASELACVQMSENLEHLRVLEDVFLDAIRTLIPMQYLQGRRSRKVPWISNICFYGVNGAELRDRLSEDGICVSRSSACTKSDDPSHVLKSIGTRQDLTPGAIRFSFGKDTSVDQVLHAAKRVAHHVSNLRKENRHAR